MRRRILLAAFLMLAALLATPVLWRRDYGGARGQEIVQRGNIAPTLRVLQGATSCATSVCHGGGGLHQRLSEATTWRSLDPHARAYSTLLNEKSQAIARQLWGAKTSAHEAALCLKCHVDPGYDHARPSFRKEDGVGCESCHGSAQGWLSDHYRDAWMKLPGADKQARGMSDTKSLDGRASVCVQCHVGMPGNDVDHDLIAAGHPVLRFEFATYFANLPPHWDVKNDRASNSRKPAQGLDFELRVWAVGQLVSSSKALELLAHRADPTSGAKWPEFAELDCFACHHDLQSASWRQRATHLKKRRPGALPKSEWYTAMLPELLTAARDEKTAKALGALQLPSFADTDGRRRIARDARGLATALLEIARQPDRLTPPDWLTTGRRLDRSWDEAVQRYFALLCARQMSMDATKTVDPSLERTIQSLWDDVTFGPAYDSPHRFVPPGATKP